MKQPDAAFPLELVEQALNIQRPPLEVTVLPGHIMRAADALRLTLAFAEAVIRTAERAGVDVLELRRTLTAIRAEI